MLKRAQQDFPNRYYGSGNVVKNIAHRLNRQARVLVSDRDELAINDLLAEGFERISLSGFDPRDSFSIVTSSLAQCSPSLLLLDPFDDFLSDYASDIVPVLPGLIASNNLPVILFVLCKDWQGEPGFNWRQLHEQYFCPAFPQLSICCTKFIGSELKGENKFQVEVLLVLPPIYKLSVLPELVARLKKFVKQLSDVLPQDVKFSTAGINGAD